MPTESSPESDPLSRSLSSEEIYGACANQGPLISGQLLTRLNLAVEPGAEVSSVTVTATGAAVKELELPYYNWSTRRDGESIRAEGPAEPREGFWFWVALKDVSPGASKVSLEVSATLADGTILRHGGEQSERPAFTVPVTPEVLANAPIIDPNAPEDAITAADETPLNGRTPCRIGEPNKGSDGSSTLPLLGAGLAGLLIGALGTFLARRNRKK